MYHRCPSCFLEEGFGMAKPSAIPLVGLISYGEITRLTLLKASVFLLLHFASRCLSLLNRRVRFELV
jgi:hypothetical protein